MININYGMNISNKDIQISLFSITSIIILRYTELPKTPFMSQKTSGPATASQTSFCRIVIAAKYSHNLLS